MPYHLTIEKKEQVNDIETYSTGAEILIKSKRLCDRIKSAFEEKGYDVKVKFISKIPEVKEFNEFVLIKK